MYYLHKTTSALSCVKPNASQREATLRDDVGFATVYRRIYRRKFLTLSNQTSRYIRECIRISFPTKALNSQVINMVIFTKFSQTSRKHAYIILTPINPNFYIVKLGFTGDKLFFFCSKGEAVLTSTHNLCFEQKYEKYQSFSCENFQVLEVKFPIHLNRLFFIM